MPYTGHPETSKEDEVRFLLGDTDVSSPRLTDSEVRYLLTTQGDVVIKAAYQGAIRLISKYSTHLSKSVGPTSLSYGDLVTNYRQLKYDLGNLGGRPTVTGPPIAGGLDSPSPLGDTDWRDYNPS